jgi:hypothetical protein
LNRAEAARLLLALFCLIQGLATMAIDLNRTHATNPLWTGHARFHLVWQVSGTAIMAALEVLLILWPGPAYEERFYLAALLAVVPLLAFLMALLFRQLYAGSLQDPNGIPQARLRLLGRVRRIDMNLFAVIAGLLVVGGLVLTFAY